MEMMMPATDQRPTRDPAGLYPPLHLHVHRPVFPELFSPSESTSLAAVLSDPGTVSPFGPPFVHSYGYGGGNSQGFGIGVGGWAGLRYCVPVYLG